MDLTTSTEQVDFHPIRGNRTVLVLGRTASQVAHFDAPDAEATTIFFGKATVSVRLGYVRATDQMGKMLLLDIAFSRVDDFALEFEQVTRNVQQVATENELVDAILKLLRELEEWRL